VSQYDDWIREDEYPDEADMEAFGDDSPPDDSPLTIGYVGDLNSNPWTARRIFLLLLGAFLLLVLLFPLLQPLLAS
jgi:hypothetical protein